MADQGTVPPFPPAPRALPRRRFASMRAIVALMLREMATTYGRSPLGYFWAILEPAAGIALLTLAFSALVRHPALGSNFPIFYATGVVPFMLYSNVSSNLTSALKFSRQLLVYPSVTFADAILARLILTLLTQLLVAYVIFTGLILTFETRTLLDLPRIAEGLLMAAALGCGVGTMNCFIAGMIPSWLRVWAILNRPLFLVSCIFFLYDDVPEPFRSWLWYNPLVHVTGQTRTGFYPYYSGDYVTPIYVFGLGLVLTAGGLLFLNRYHRHILNN